MPYTIRIPLSKPVTSSATLWFSSRSRYQIIAFSSKGRLSGTVWFRRLVVSSWMAVVPDGTGSRAKVIR